MLWQTYINIRGKHTVRKVFYRELRCLGVGDETSHCLNDMLTQDCGRKPAVQSEVRTEKP